MFYFFCDSTLKNTYNPAFSTIYNQPLNFFFYFFGKTFARSASNVSMTIVIREGPDLRNGKDF